MFTYTMIQSIWFISESLVDEIFSYKKSSFHSANIIKKDKKSNNVILLQQ